MYNFVDTTETPGALPLPAEAMSYGGVYIENEIEGYRTLYVEGRETITAAIEATETQTRHGSSFRNMRYEPRTLTIGFQLICETAAAMMASYNKLLHILSQKQAQIIFNDEQDKYYTGTKTKITNTPPGRLAVTGEIEIYCADPFKYSVQEYVATATNGVITVNYDGTYPAHPILTAISANHDNGFYSFTNQSNHRVQAGNPAEQDGQYVPSDTAITLVDTYFSNGADSSAPPRGMDKWSYLDTVILFDYLKEGSFIFANTYMYADIRAPYEDSLKYYFGPALGSNLQETIPNFELSLVNWFEPAEEDGGGFDIYVSNENGDNIAGISIWKDKNGNIQACMIVRGRYVKRNSYSRAENPFNGWRTQKITKSGTKVTFSFGGYRFTVDDPNLASSVFDAKNITFVMYRQPKSTQIGINNALQSVLFRGIPNRWDDIDNKIQQNSLIEVDTGNGSITADGEQSPDLGTVENDFEGFVLEYGENAITCDASEWVDDAVYKARYREVFL